MNASAIRRATLIAVAVGAISSFGAGSASAQLRDTDRPIINTAHADFGTGGLVGVFPPRAPSAPGTLTWDQSLAFPTTPSTITARLTGTVYWDSLSGGCARVRMTLFETNGAQVGAPTYSARACKTVTSFTPASKTVDLSLKSINAHKVVVTTQVGKNVNTTSADYLDAGSQTWYYGQIPQD